MKRTILSVAVFALPTLASASTIAVIDSGTDYMHEKLVKQYELNAADPKDGADNDGNGFVDDVHGWNFAEQNNQVIDYSYLGKFSTDTRKFFEVQTRMLEGNGTAEDKKWMEAKRQDEEFIKELQIFGNFTHGTHVAGITAKEHPESKVFAVKLIPTEVKLPFSVYLAENGFFRSELRDPRATSSLKEIIFKQGLALLAGAQGKGLLPIGQYVGARAADVANGSFGTSYTALKGMIEQLYNAFFKEGERDPAKVEEFTKFFLETVVTQMSGFVKAAPKTLFVFAAGNDGTNNDLYPVSPANVKTDNSITVAATLKDGALASFSNFGEDMVDVAAPGVGIVSTIPGNEMMVMSGTSQAAPYVSNMAAEMKNLNPALKPYELRMLIMGTVDKKAWLNGKVKTSGLVNAERAFVAAKASTTMDLHSAIASSFKTVKPKAENPFARIRAVKQPTAAEAMVLPLPSIFEIGE